MTWVVLAVGAWGVLAVAVGLLVGGAVGLEERNEPRAGRGCGSGRLREGSLDGERQPRTLQAREEHALIG